MTAARAFTILLVTVFGAAALLRLVLTVGLLRTLARLSAPVGTRALLLFLTFTFLGLLATVGIVRVLSTYEAFAQPGELS